MRKFLTALGLAALLSVSFWGVAPNAHAEIAGATFTAVDTSSSTVCTTADNQTVTAFASGTYDQVIDLQLESGSPGSGAFQTVSGGKDIFPTANAQTTFTHTAGLLGDCFRLNVRTDDGGTLYYTVLTGRTTPTEWNSSAANLRTHYRLFDDFQGGVMPITTAGEINSWLTHEGADGDATVAATQIEPEGAVEMGWGDAATDISNTSSLTFGNASEFALVSLGTTVFEIRAHLSQVTVGIWNLGLADTISQTAADVVGFDTSTLTYTEGVQTDLADAAFIHMDTAATGDLWASGSLNTNTTQNGGIAFQAGAGPTAVTYQIFRIEIDTTGDASYFLDGALFHAQTTAVATTALLTPHISVYTVDTTLGNLVIDYIDFWAARPAG